MQGGASGLRRKALVNNEPLPRQSCARWLGSDGGSERIELLPRRLDERGGRGAVASAAPRWSRSGLPDGGKPNGDIFSGDRGLACSPAAPGPGEPGDLRQGECCQASEGVCPTGSWPGEVAEAIAVGFGQEGFLTHLGKTSTGIRVVEHDDHPFHAAGDRC